MLSKALAGFESKIWWEVTYDLTKTFINLDKFGDNCFLNNVSLPNARTFTIGIMMNEAI